ncbi:MAG: hypothetical protein OEQ13_03770 [Acidobacteriota bacterium]|nr:hypothetical protein [Acidobacteriota bacterium]
MASGSGPWCAVFDGDLGVAAHRLADTERERIERALAARPGVAAVVSPVRRLATELVLLADVVICSPGATLAGGGEDPPRLPGTPRRLAGRLGGGPALAFWLSRRAWPARRARRAGLVDVVSRDPVSHARRIVELWKEAGRAPEWLKLLTERSPGLGERGARSLERALFALAFTEPDARRGAREFLGGRRRRSPDGSGPAPENDGGASHEA